MKRTSAVEVAQALLSKTEDSEDPWLISYADLVTNLLAFMVLLVSMAGISLQSVEGLPSMFSSKRGQPPLQALANDMMNLTARQGVQSETGVEITPDGLALRLADSILFPSGVSELTEHGSGLVKKVSKLLQNLPDRFRVRVEGHTDEQPIATQRFASNWELSAARAIEVREALGSSGFPEARLAIAAYADTRPPLISEDLALDERRARARRVVIRVHY